MFERGGDLGRDVSRRGFLFVGAASAAVLIVRAGTHIARVEAKANLPREVKIVEFTQAGKQAGTMTVPTITKPDAEWRQQLSPIAFNVTRQEGTERAFTGPGWDLHEKGLYRCVCCDTALFSSETKFDSGTGWPSFWRPIAKENVRETSDYSLGVQRTAVACRRCDAHLGHVFDDGPRPTGLRYCMNAVAMKFVKAA